MKLKCESETPMRTKMPITLVILILAAWTKPAFTTPPATAPATQPADNLSKAEKLFREGTDALYQGKYDQAVDLLKEAAALDKTKSSYRMHLARAYRYAGKSKEAEALLEEILKQTPDHVEAGQILGEIYARQENWKKVAA